MRRPRLLSILSAAGLVLAAAGCERPRKATAPGTPAPRIAAPFDGDVLTLTEAGAGPISRDTPFSAEAIAALFPNASVANHDLWSGTDMVPAILVHQRDLVIRIDGDPGTGLITSVSAAGENVRGPNGERLHDRGGPASFSPGQCAPGPATQGLGPQGLDPQGFDLVCRRTADSHVALTYTLGDFAQRPAGISLYGELVAHGFLGGIAWQRSPPV
ncbi:MAG: hypothetical protein JWP35_4615 [Caulobacter sp.]|nr:hypothetical protein [Caulobacter sp.]